LLAQVDTMIHHKRLKWERQKQELDNKMLAKEQENIAQKAALEQKNNEVIITLNKIHYVQIRIYEQ
jgi:hypothetical protein